MVLNLLTAPSAAARLPRLLAEAAAPLIGAADRKSVV